MIDVKNINNKKDPSKYTYGVLNLMCFVLVFKNDDLIFGIKIYEGEIIWMRLQMDVSFRFVFGFECMFSLFIHSFSCCCERWVSFLSFQQKKKDELNEENEGVWIQERKNVYIEYSIRSMMIILFWTGSRLNIDDDDDDFAQTYTHQTHNQMMIMIRRQKK